MPEVPLTALLSWTWIALTIEVDNAVEDAGSERVGRLFNISLPMWGNGLRLIGSDGITLGELHRHAGCACNVAGLERWRWIEIGAGGGERRKGYGTRKGLTDDTVLRLTRAGAYARRLFAEAVPSAEEAWSERFGADVVGAVRAALPPAPDDMPWSVPEVHASDGFRTHVAAEGPPGAGRPLSALLAAALTSLTLAHERDARVALPLGANALRVLGSEPVPARELPARAGVSKEAIAMSLGYLERHGLATIGAGRAVRLTARGTAAREAHATRAAAPEDRPLRAALAALLSDTDALRGGLRPPDQGWRARRPYLAQTTRILEDPLGALPWQPMVLHRGGWPDGS